MSAFHSSVLVILLLSVTLIESAKILGVFIVPSYSHQVVFHPIYKELSLRGHEVTVITPNPLEDSSLTNLTEINVDYLYNNTAIIEVAFADSPSTQSLSAGMKWCDSLLEEILQDERVQQIYKDPSREFELVLVEALTPALYAFAVCWATLVVDGNFELFVFSSVQVCWATLVVDGNFELFVFSSVQGRFKAPLVGAISMDAMLFNHHSVGNPVHPVLYGDMMSKIHENMSVWEKMYYVYYITYDRYNYYFNVIPRANKLAQKYFGELMPYSIEELDRNISLLLVNFNMFLNPIRPTVPQMVHMGLMHIKPVKPLPTNLQHILGNASQGVIYFSLGTNVKTLSKTLESNIIGALGDLPYTVLWKREADNVTGLPENIITRKWFPQQDVLAHVNVKAFVTQGGLQSTEEAISRGVPMVGIPFLADQYMIISKLAKLGVAVELDNSTLTKEKLKRAIIEVAENRKYKQKILEVRDIVRDQPMTGLERAIWWCEYVIRHNGTSHLRSPRADIPLYKFLLLDVALVVLVVTVVVLYLVSNGFKFIFTIVKSNRTKAKMS